MKINIKKQDYEKSAWERSLEARKHNEELIKQARTIKDTPVGAGARRQDGYFETYALRTARLAEEQRRKDLKNPPVKPTPAPLEDADRDAIFQSFLNRTPEFFPSPWNVEMLNRCITYNIGHGRISGFTGSALNACFEYLQKGGFLEGRNPKRGDSKPREFEEYVAPPPTPDANARIPLQQPSVTQVISAEEHARLQNMPLDDLMAEVRKGYNYNYKKAGEYIR